MPFSFSRYSSPTSEELRAEEARLRQKEHQKERRREAAEQRKKLRGCHANPKDRHKRFTKAHDGNGSRAVCHCGSDGQCLEDEVVEFDEFGVILDGSEVSPAEDSSEEDFEDAEWVKPPHYYPHILEGRR
ncbi:MAG: hypothetical protein KBD50_02015 [Candidatus Pacebacteria bacterium]|nr:hypothetical protein [Candidatus Paceibacterota bacterium]